MKSVLFSGVFAILALSVAGAPTYSEGEQPRYLSKQQMQQIEELLRERRAPLGQQFVAPCASAGAVQLPVSSVPVAAFSAPSFQGYGAVPQYGFGGPHYRSVDEQLEPELLGFPDMDQSVQGHVPMARLGGYGGGGLAGVSPGMSAAGLSAAGLSAAGLSAAGLSAAGLSAAGLSGAGLSGAGLSAAGLSAAGGRMLTQGTSGTALGVFPNANIGGCSVPLLLSCSPTIVPGHIVASQSHVAPAYASAVADSYRLVNEPEQHETHDHHEEMLTHEHMSHEPSHAAHQ